MPDEKLAEEHSKMLAKLFCEAKSLRVQRFFLADQIRFAEDTLIRHQEFSNMGQIKLRFDSLNLLIEPLHQMTKLMADSISKIQIKLFEEFYVSKQNRTYFDKAFQKAILEICP